MSGVASTDPHYTHYREVRGYNISRDVEVKKILYNMILQFECGQKTYYWFVGERK